MTPGSAESPNRSRWMHTDGQGLLAQPLLGMYGAANLERARTKYRQERHTINQQGPEHTTLVVAAAELSHNAAGRASTLAQLYRHLGHPVALLGSHFPQWGRELWEPIRGAVRQQALPVHSVVVEHEQGFVNQAWELVLHQPADRVHLSKPRLPAVVFGLLYKRLCHGLPEPSELMGPLWTRLAVDLAQRFAELFEMTPLAVARG